MSAKPATAENKPKGLASLNERERRLLSGMLFVFFLLGTFLIYYVAQSGQAKTEAEIERLEGVLKSLNMKGPAYLEREQSKSKQSVENDRFSADRMLKNDIKLTSFVAQKADSTGIKVDNYDESQLPLASGKDGGPIITEKMLRFDIREASMTSLLQLLDSIEKSREPVIIKNIDLRDVRNKPGLVRVKVTISTYVQKNKEG